MNPHLRLHISAWVFAALIALTSCAHTAEQVLYEKASAFNTVIVTEDEQGLRTLRFEKGGARQSVVKPGDPDYLGFAYTPAAFVGLALAKEPQRFLVVGLGGGTMPMFLRKRYPNATIDAVEIDPEVVYVAKEFFGFREDERMRAHVADGRRFVESSKERYDVIFLDAFGAHSVPPRLATIEFLSAVRRAVKPDGVVVGNLWGESANSLYDSMVRTYQEAFDDLYILEVGGSSNRILLSLPRKQKLTREDLSQLARKAGIAAQFPFDLGDIARHGFLYANQRNRDGRVLRDKDFAKGGKARPMLTR